MTPLHLDILMHYCTRAEDYEKVGTNDTRKEYAYNLAECGYLYTPSDKQLFAVTEYGRKTFEKVVVFFNEVGDGEKL